MADAEADRERGATLGASEAVLSLRERLRELDTALRGSPESGPEAPEAPARSSAGYCRGFCEVLVEFGSQWRVDTDPLPLLEVYTEAILSYARATPFLSSECENVPLILERLTLSCAELLLAQTEPVPSPLWERFQASVQTSHSLLQQSGNCQLWMLCALSKERGVWANSTLCQILDNVALQTEEVHEFLALEGPVLLDLRVKQLKNSGHFEKAALLAKQCAEYPGFGGKDGFMQTYLVCLCAAEPQDQLMLKISEVDCKDVLEMVCNLESDGDDQGALRLCSTFLTRQLLQGDLYCAWELTLFWSKLLKRVEPSSQAFLDQCRRMSRLSKTVYHILFLIKVIQAELNEEGLPVCIEMCIQALKMVSSNEGNVKATLCKTISCLLPADLEVKRACQLTEFLLEPTVDSYYAVESLYNEPDQKQDEDDHSVPYSLRCELFLVFKTLWPFDPEFWDWKALKRQCLVLMGEQSSIVSSIDKLNDSKNPDGDEDDFKDPTDCFLDATNQLNEIEDERMKKREVKKLREKGFISARFRNWQAYVQYCVLCDKEFLGHRIVRHAEKHYIDGVYSCPICTTNFNSKEQLIPHVTSHVKQSCKERLAAMKTGRVLGTSKKDLSDPSSSQKTESATEAFEEERSMEHFCPVTNCQKGFKFFRNMMAHVKTHGNNEEAKCFLEIQSKKVVCNFCRRQFMSIAHLNDHLQMHCSDKPYICVQLNCKASFLSNTELLMHRKEHTTFKAKCMFPNCGKIFTEAYLLYDHEARHYNTFTCKVSGCGKLFHTKSQLDLHQEDHVTKQDAPVTEEQTCVFPDQKTEPPTQIQLDQELNHPYLNKLLSNDENRPSESVVQSVSSCSTSELVTQETIPVKIKHSVESILNTASSCGGVEQNISLKLESAAEPQQKMSNSDDPVVQSSAASYVSHSEQPELESIAPSSHQSFMEVNFQGPACALNQTITENLLPPPATDLRQSHAQNPGSFSTSDQSNQDHHLPTQSLDWSRDQTQTALQDPKLYSCDWNHPVTSFRASCKSEPLEFSQHASGDAYGSTDSGSANHLCTFDKQVVVQQIPPSMPQLNSASQSVVATGVPAQLGLAVGDKTIANISHQSSGAPAAAQGAKERHFCLFETCPRNYSCRKSANKHMKAAHPDFYAQWKLEKEKNKVSHGPTRVRTDRRRKVLPATDAQSITNQQMSHATSCKNPPASSGKLTENVINAVLPPQPGKPHSAAALTPTGPMLPNTNGSLLPLLAGNHSGISGQTNHPSECLPQELRSGVSHVLSSEMNESHAGYPSQTIPAHASDTVSQIYNGTSCVGEISAAHDSHPFVTTQICGRSWQSEFQANADPVFCLKQADGVNSEMKYSSVDGGSSINNSGAAFHTTNARGINPIIQSPMEQDSQLSTPLFGESSRLSQFSTRGSFDATSQKTNEGLINISSSDHSTSPKHAVGRSVLVSAVKNVLDGAKDILEDQPGNSVSSVLPIQSQRCSSSGLSTSERIAPSQMNVSSMEEAVLSRVDVKSLETSNISGQGTTPQMKKRRQSNRTKWPAILKDGKYLCCRCFREFQSPKSLGGHLSKRSLCKGPTETGLTDHSQQTTDVCTQPAVSTVNPNLHCEDQPGQSFSAAIKQELSPGVNLTQANHFVCEGRKDGESLQRFDKLPIPSRPVIVSSRFAPGTFHKPCESYSPKSGVIHRAGTLNFNTEKEYGEDGLSKSAPPQPQSSISSPHLPSLLVENGSLENSCPSDALNEILRAEALSKIRELKESAVKSQSFGLSNDALLATISSLAQNLTRNPSPQLISPDVQQVLLRLRDPLDFNENKNLEEDIRNKLRDQTFTGDILRRVNVCGESGTDASTTSSEPPVEESPGGPMATPRTGSECIAPTSEGGTVTASPSQTDGALLMKGSSELASVVCEKSDLGEPMKDEDEWPAQSAGDEKVMEIQRALQRLDLDKETIEDQSFVGSCSPPNVSDCNKDLPDNVESLKTIDLDRTNQIDVLENSSKPFLCEEEGCEYGAMTKEALFKHLIRVHDYTDDMLTELKKNPAKLSPYCCHLCTKTFTRNTNLRVHCQSAHKMSRAEFSQLKLRFRSKRKAGKDIPEEEVSNSQNGVCRLNTPSSQKVPLSYATSETITDKRQVPLHLPSEQNTGYKQKAITKEYVSCSSEEQTSAQQISNAGQSPNVHHSCAAGPSLEGQLRRPARASVRLAASVSPQASPSQAKSSFFEEKPPKLNHPETVKSQIESPLKTKEKKEYNEAEDAFSPYRPYRCVHEGCVAAFTIQQNLILHYKAVHHSALPIFDTEDTDGGEDVSHEVEDEVGRMSEFRCQVKDCSRIFRQIPGLLQHYLQLHEFSLDKAVALMSNINFQRFQCDQPECTSSFWDFHRYIGHIKDDHKVAKVSKADGVEETFRCEYVGCDRVYSSRSNVTRHIMNKHQDLYKLLMRKQSREKEQQAAKRSKELKIIGVKTNGGKENRENQKHRQKRGNKRRPRSRCHWINFGMPSLKSLDEASGMCTKKFALQYPCMLKGCDSVMRSERNALRHYASHGLTERYIEEHRSGFIFCKKSKRQKESGDDTTDSSDVDESENEKKETEISKGPSRKEESPEPREDKQLSNENTETKSVEPVVVKRKRGRPRKVPIAEPKIVAPENRKESLRNGIHKENQVGNCADHFGIVHEQKGQPENAMSLSSFKPMGFEVSFLQFLEKSAERGRPAKREASEKHSNEMPSKRRCTLQQRTVNIICERPNLHRRAKNHQNLVDFRNPLKLKSVKNVKIVVDTTFSSIADLLLKQLQEMRPMVILEKWLYS